MLTNDGHAILREIDVTHPAAKVRGPTPPARRRPRKGRRARQGRRQALGDPMPGPLCRARRVAFAAAAAPLGALGPHTAPPSCQPPTPLNRLLPPLNPQPPPTPPQSMIQLSRTQDEEVGDGTTSVIILAGELLQARALWGGCLCGAPAGDGGRFAGWAGV